MTPPRTPIPKTLQTKPLVEEVVKLTYNFDKKFNLLKQL